MQLFEYVHWRDLVLHVGHGCGVRPAYPYLINAACRSGAVVSLWPICVYHVTAKEALPADFSYESTNDCVSMLTTSCGRERSVIEPYCFELLM